MKSIIYYILLFISIMCLQVKYAVAGSNESSDLLVEGQFEKSNIVEHWVFCVPQTTVKGNYRYCN